MPLPKSPVPPSFGVSLDASVECMSATADVRWLYVGLSCGTIIRYDLFGSFMGKGGDLPPGSPLTHWTAHTAQELGRWDTDSVLKSTTLSRGIDTRSSESSKSPSRGGISSLLADSEAVWCMSGHQSGHVALWSDRSAVGECIWSQQVHSVRDHWPLEGFKKSLLHCVFHHL